MYQRPGGECWADGGQPAFFTTDPGQKISEVARCLARSPGLLAFHMFLIGWHDAKATCPSTPVRNLRNPFSPPTSAILSKNDPRTCEIVMEHVPEVNRKVSSTDES